jgi:hypothetical protein
MLVRTLRSLKPSTDMATKPLSRSLNSADRSENALSSNYPSTGVRNRTPFVQSAACRSPALHYGKNSKDVIYCPISEPLPCQVTMGKTFVFIPRKPSKTQQGTYFLVSPVRAWRCTRMSNRQSASREPRNGGRLHKKKAQF